MSDYKRVPTSAEVWAVIRARHPEMRVFGSYSAPDGDEFVNPSKGRMFTSYGFEHGDYPVIEAQMIAAVTEAVGEAAAAQLSTMKKDAAAERAEEMLKDTGWLPSPMRTVQT